MKIAILVTQFPPKWNDGTQIATYKTAKYLAKIGHEVHVITRHSLGLQFNEIKDGFYIHRIKLLNIRFLGIVLYFISLLKLIKKIRPQIIHAQMLVENGWFAGVIKKLQNIPYINYLRGSDIYESSHLYKKTVAKFVFKNANSIIAQTNDMKLEIQKVSNRDVFVIPNGSEPEKFVGLRKKNCRKELGIKNNEKIILFIGRLIVIKCVDDLINAAKEVVLKEKDVRLYIVGEGNEKEKLIKLVKNESLEDCVKFMGKVPNEIIPKYIIASDIFALVSYTEGYPMVFSEVLPSGLPIVTSNVRGIPEIIENGRNGLVVEPHNIHQIAKAILLLLKDEQLRQKIYKNNIEKGKVNSWENVIKRLEKVYMEVLKCQR